MWRLHLLINDFLSSQVAQASAGSLTCALQAEDVRKLSTEHAERNLRGLESRTMDIGMQRVQFRIGVVSAGDI